MAANYADACDTYGRDLAKTVWHFTADNHPRMLEALGGTSHLYARRGSWTLAESAAEAETLRRSEQLLREDGWQSRWHDAPTPPLDRLHGGLLNPDDGEIDPASAVRKLGAPHMSRVYTGVDVTALDSSPSGVRVVAGDRELLAEVVVLATNAFAGDLAPEVPVAPTRAQMLAAQVATPCTDRPAYSNYGYNYWRQVPGGAVLLGGCRDTEPEAEVTTVAEPTPSIQSCLEAHLRRLGAEPEVSHRWAGIMGFSPDALPLVGPVPGRPGLFFCGGYTGHGMNFAFTCAELLAEHLRGGPALPAWLRLDRFGG